MLGDAPERDLHLFAGRITVPPQLERRWRGGIFEMWRDGYTAKTAEVQGRGEGGAAVHVFAFGGWKGTRQYEGALRAYKGLSALVKRAQRRAAP